MKISVFALAVLFFYPALAFAQRFDGWGELSVLGLGRVDWLEYSPDGSKQHEQIVDLLASQQRAFETICSKRDYGSNKPCANGPNIAFEP